MLWEARKGMYSSVKMKWQGTILQQIRWDNFLALQIKSQNITVLFEGRDSWFTPPQFPAYNWGLRGKAKSVLLSQTCSELLSTQLCCSGSEGQEISICCFCTTCLRTRNRIGPVTSSSLGPRSQQPLTFQGRSPVTFFTCTCIQNSSQFRPRMIFPGCILDSASHNFSHCCHCCYTAEALAQS